MECLLGVVQLDYNPDSDIFVIDADQLKALESKCRQTSKAASSQREAAASAAARRAQQHEAEGLQPQQVAVVNRYGRTTTKDVAPAAPAKCPPAATSARPPGKAPRVERMPASSKAAGKRPTSGTTVVAKPRARGWEPTGWAAREEPLHSASQRECAAALHPAHGSRRRLTQSIAAGGWFIPCAANARRRRLQRRPWAAGGVGGRPRLQRGGQLAWWQADRWD